MKCFNYFVAFLLLITNGNCKLPDYIHVCYRGDPNIADCIKNSIESLRPMLRGDGIPELKVPSLEPFSMNQISIHSLGGAASLVTNITDPKVYGASTFQIVSIVPILKKNGYTFQFEFTVPQVRMEAQYEIDAQILALKLLGRGPFTANVTNYNCTCVMRGKKVDIKEDTYLQFQQMECNLKIDKAQVHLGNIANGNEVLEKATNEVINDNWQLFFEEIRPNLLDSLEKMFTDIANKITLHFKYDELFP